jgi:hypothetical protein
MFVGAILLTFVGATVILVGANPPLSGAISMFVGATRLLACLTVVREIKRRESSRTNDDPVAPTTTQAGTGAR